jgi:hypothetical protein
MTLATVLAAGLAAQAGTVEKARCGEIRVEAEAGAAPPRFRITTPRYEILSELREDQLPPLQIGKVLEAVRPLHEAFFDVKVPPERERWKVEISAAQEDYRAAARRDRFDPVGGGRYLWNTRTVYLWWQAAGADFTRGLLLHEATHPFHHRSGVAPGASPARKGQGSAKFKFVTEGLATFFEGHAWDAATDTLRVGAPLGRDRVKAALDQLGRRKRTFEDLIESDKDYPEVWSLTSFLVHRKPEEAARLLRDPAEPARAWAAAFGSTAISEAFLEEYRAWLVRMAETPKDVQFTTWDALVRHAPARPK